MQQSRPLLQHPRTARLDAGSVVLGQELRLRETMLFVECLCFNVACLDVQVGGRDGVRPPQWLWLVLFAVLALLGLG